MVKKSGIFGKKIGINFSEKQPNFLGEKSQQN